MTFEAQQQEPDGIPHLILHKVRGEPAFDVAVTLPVGNEVWWIIPTSGHRAYPTWWLPLTDIMFGLEITELSYDRYKWKDITDLPPIPSDWPDHYSVNDRAKVVAETNAAPKTSQRPKPTVEDLLF